MLQQRRPTHDEFEQVINHNHPRYKADPKANRAPEEAYLDLNQNLFLQPARQPDAVSVWLDGVPPAIIHLPVTAETPEAAVELAHQFTAWLAHVPELRGHDVRVSTRADAWRRVYCNLTLDDGARCPRLWRHAGACGKPAD